MRRFRRSRRLATRGAVYGSTHLEAIGKQVGRLREFADECGHHSRRGAAGRDGRVVCDLAVSDGWSDRG